jgi:hypothetical protein
MYINNIESGGGIMELSQVAIVLWFIPVTLQIILPLFLLSGFLLLRAAQHLFGIKLRPSVAPCFVESLASEKV